MNRLSKQKLGKRLIAVIVSIMASVAVVAVGVYASSSNFSVQVKNEVDINVATVNGTLSARRGGDVIYGTESLGDNGKDSSGKGPIMAETQSLITSGVLSSGALATPDSSGNYLVLWDNFMSLEEKYQFNEDNKEEIQKPVNFYLSAKDDQGNQKQFLTIYYVFKFEVHEETPQNVKITMTNKSTQLTDKRADFVTMDFKYVQGDVELQEPTNWSASGTSLGIETIESGQATKSADIVVESANANTYMTYIYVAMTVERTSTLADAYTLGYGGENFNWAFALNIELTNV